MNTPSSPNALDPITTPVRIGLFGIGLDAYWPQFSGLKERLEGYLARVAVKLGRPGVEIVNVGLVDNPDRAYEAGREFRRADVDLIFLHVTTYALSSTVLPVVRRGGIRARADPRDRQHQQPLPFLLRRAGFRQPLECGRPCPPLCGRGRKHCAQDRKARAVARFGSFSCLLRICPPESPRRFGKRCGHLAKKR